MEIAEVIRRWRAGGSQRHTASGMGLSRDTAGKYITAAAGLGLSLEGPDPSGERLSRLSAMGRPGLRRAVAPGQGLLEPWAGQVRRRLTGERLRLTRIHGLLAARGCRGAVYLPVALRGPLQLAGADRGRGADGGPPAGRGGRDGLRPPGSDS